MKASLAKIGNHTLATIAFAANSECPPLMIGDFLSHAVWSMDQVKRSENRPDEEFFGNGTRGKTNLTHITFVPGGLANVREYLVNRVRARQRKTQTTLALASGAQPSKAT